MQAVEPFAAVNENGAMVIRLPMPTPSLNEWNGKRWFAKAKIKTTWQTAIALLVGGARTRPEDRRRVTVIRFGKRDLDHDNLWAGCKPVLDALTGVGLIRDDAPKWLDLHVSQERPPKGFAPYTTICIE